MNQEITFENIHKNGAIVEENERYKQNQFLKIPNMYDANYIAFKQMPTLAEFKEAEEYLRGYHMRLGQNHVKFYFPEGIKITDELDNYLSTSGYDTGFMELYKVDPSKFPEVPMNDAIKVREVSEKNLEPFLDLIYKHTLAFGEKFAQYKRSLIREQCLDDSQKERHLKLFATYDGKAAGYAHVIISKAFVEIDNLEVDEVFQKKGIGSALQRKVMDLFSDRTVILVADGEDTPRNMYRKQNYQYVGFQYEALKVLE
ncbi:GNAT family N-acetyltransferase [Aquibacillus koreensis]|uniref:GNAT family N-acetyltransferase n=1 Tax=Aquibacillus koreensis TaxID=279446 RepID=A0A9X3WGY6_9BACI|nr:GNAT family N-acetyltransferase [Aquibacillus koreensis]MCT2534834.1 GNAT family N-acetyltransferase [Aquibacillus koreensis]MDC3419555.1 GNAT family N-acetyltransferase [Aquibacillus koreensis]